MTTQSRAWALLLTLLVGAQACSKAGDAGKPGGLPPLDPTQAGSAPPAAPPAASPAPPPSARPVPTFELANPEPPPKPDPATSIAGRILLPTTNRGSVGRGDTIYLVARRVSDNPQVPGSLVAVQKIAADAFPLEFAISGRDTMVPGAPFAGEMTLTARVDKDGDPMTRRKGDVLGVVKKVQVGNQDVTINLDTVQPQDESLGGGPATANPHEGNPHGGKPLGHP